jgi:hypothetical protein
MGNANLVEGSASWPGGIAANADKFIAWNNQVLNFPDPQGMPRYNAFWDAYVSQDLKQMRWGLTLAMMASMYYMSPNANGWYDEYWGGSLNRRGYLGKATGPAVKLQNGVWRRDFENGIALNNSTGSTQTVSLGATFRHLTGTQAPLINDGSSVTVASVPAQDGVILLR